MFLAEGALHRKGHGEKHQRRKEKLPDEKEIIKPQRQKPGGGLQSGLVEGSQKGASGGAEEHKGGDAIDPTPGILLQDDYPQKQQNDPAYVIDDRDYTFQIHVQPTLSTKAILPEADPPPASLISS